MSTTQEKPTRTLHALQVEERKIQRRMETIIKNYETALRDVSQDLEEIQDSILEVLQAQIN